MLVLQLFCDGDECSRANSFKSYYLMDRTTDPLVLRARAKEKGWVCVNGKDYCEECNPTKENKDGE